MLQILSFLTRAPTLPDSGHYLRKHLPNPSDNHRLALGGERWNAANRRHASPGHASADGCARNPHVHENRLHHESDAPIPACQIPRSLRFRREAFRRSVSEIAFETSLMMRRQRKVISASSGGSSIVLKSHPLSRRFRVRGAHPTFSKRCPKNQCSCGSPSSP